MISHDTLSSEKAEIAQDDFPEQVRKGGALGRNQQHGHLNKTEEEIERIDAIALAQNTTLESFAHLDEKKILRKV